MAGISPQHWWLAGARDDLLRGGAIALLVALCILTTVLAFALGIDILTAQIFFIPIIYAVYVFPRRGIIVSAICACAYEFTGYAFRYPDPVGLAAITVQAVLFVRYRWHPRVFDRDYPKSGETKTCGEDQER